jgi:hypothetical protein
VEGPLAGSEIRLLAVAGRGAIEAQLLTSAASSRQTLDAVMDEIRRRLRGKGVALAAPRARPPIDGPQGGRRRGPAGRPA